MNKLEKIKTIFILIWFILSTIGMFTLIFIDERFIVPMGISLLISSGLLLDWNRGSMDLSELFKLNNK